MIACHWSTFILDSEPGEQLMSQFESFFSKLSLYILFFVEGWPLYTFWSFQTGSVSWELLNFWMGYVIRCKTIHLRRYSLLHGFPYFLVLSVIRWCKNILLQKISIKRLHTVNMINMETLTHSFAVSWWKLMFVYPNWQVDSETQVWIKVHNWDILKISKYTITLPRILLWRFHVSSS